MFPAYWQSSEPASTSPPRGAAPVKAEGMIRLVPQDRLRFGRDRREPVDRRPVVTVRRGMPGGRVLALPCTTQPPRRAAEFFALTPERVLWRRPDNPASWAWHRAEQVSEEDLGWRIGTLTQAARLELARWLRERW